MNKMMMTKKTIHQFYLIISITLLLPVAGWFFHEKVILNTDNTVYQINVLNIDKDFGYQIIKNHKVIIYQPFWPGLKGQVPFKTRQEAKTVAELVVSKLEKGQSPALTKEDIDKLQAWLAN